MKDDKLKNQIRLSYQMIEKDKVNTGLSVMTQQTLNVHYKKKKCTVCGSSINQTDA